jgi:hypothetical protein
MNDLTSTNWARIVEHSRKASMCHIEVSKHLCRHLNYSFEPYLNNCRIGGRGHESLPRRSVSAAQ